MFFNGMELFRSMLCLNLGKMQIWRLMWLSIWRSIYFLFANLSSPIWSCYFCISRLLSDKCNLLTRQKYYRQLSQGKFANYLLSLHTIHFFSRLVSTGVKWNNMIISHHSSWSKFLLKESGEFWCQLVQYLIVVTALVSIYTLVLMSVARLGKPSFKK